MIFNNGTDAGKGRTRIDLLEKLIKAGRVNVERQSVYHHSTYSLYELNTTLSSPKLLEMEGEGLFKRNATQTLHTT